MASGRSNHLGKEVKGRKPVKISFGIDSAFPVNYLDGYECANSNCRSEAVVRGERNVFCNICGSTKVGERSV